MASSNFSGQQPFSQEPYSELHVTAIEQPELSPTYPPSHSPSAPSQASVPPYNHDTRYSTLEATEKGPVAATSPHSAYDEAPPSAVGGAQPVLGAQKKRWSRKKFILIVSVIAVIVIAAVVGGVLGALLTKKKPGSGGGSG
jgi:hypothetical protein